LDDATYATLSSLMLFNNVDVVLGLYQDAAFLPRVSQTHSDTGLPDIQ
jgi:protein phosphatase-4 regulatory subunit 3